MTEPAPAPTPPPTPARRARPATGGPRRILGIVVAVAFVLFVIWGLFQATRPPPDQLQGVVDTDQVNAATKVLSRVEKLLVREGDQVQAGQTLAVLSSPEAEGGAAQAQAALSGARALQDRALNGDRPQDISALEAAWRAAQAQADLASTSARRADNLFAEGVIAAQRRDEADAARASAAQNAEAAHQLYLKAIAGVRSEDKQVAASQVAGAEAGARVSASLLDETRLVAPISGEIDKKYANPGEIVLPSVPVFTLIDLGDLWVSVNVREDEFRGVGMGRTIQGSIPALGLKGVPFKIDYISPQGDFATWRSTHQSSGYDVKSFEVRARPVHPVAGLRPGMSVLFPWPQG